MSRNFQYLILVYLSGFCVPHAFNCPLFQERTLYCVVYSKESSLKKRTKLICFQQWEIWWWGQKQQKWNTTDHLSYANVLHIIGCCVELEGSSVSQGLVTKKTLCSVHSASFPDVHVSSSYRRHTELWWEHSRPGTPAAVRWRLDQRQDIPAPQSYQSPCPMLGRWVPLLVCSW